MRYLKHSNSQKHRTEVTRGFVLLVLRPWGRLPGRHLGLLGPRGLRWWPSPSLRCPRLLFVPRGRGPFQTVAAPGQRPEAPYRGGRGAAWPALRSPAACAAADGAASRARLRRGSWPGKAGAHLRGAGGPRAAPAGGYHRPGQPPAPQTPRKRTRRKKREGSPCLGATSRPAAAPVALTGG